MLTQNVHHVFLVKIHHRIVFIGTLWNYFQDVNGITGFARVCPKVFQSLSFEEDSSVKNFNKENVAIILSCYLD